MDELNALDSTVESIIVDGCNDESFTVLNMTRFVNLKVFEVDDYSFYFVTEVHLIGLPELERVVIGENSFTKYKHDWTRYMNLTGNFHLKDCPQLRELKIGQYSFNEYTKVEIENMNSLEVIEIGDIGGYSYNFWEASVELKSGM